MVKFFRFNYIFFISIVLSQNVDVSVDRKQIYEGESITLNITIKNGEEPEININKIKDFQIVSGPNSSTQMQWINGKMSSTYSLSWQLIPLRVGQLKIPSFKIRFKNKSINSSEIKINVLNIKQNKNKENIKQQYFIEANINNKYPFRGEQIVLTYSLYTKVNLSSFDFSKMSSFKDFWSKDLYTPRNLQFREKKIANQIWYISTVKEVALFPTKSGEIIINPATIIIGVKTASNRRTLDFFGDDFFGRSKQVTLATNQIELEVKALPSNNNKPSSAVGKWDISSFINNKKLKQDEAFTYSIIIKGTGNIKSIEPLEINFPKSLEIFDPEINVVDKTIKNKLGGKKIIEYVIIPREYGEVNLPKVELSYFDINDKEWKTKKTKEIKLVIEKNEKSVQTSIGLSKEEVLLIGKDIKYIDLNHPKWLRSNNRLFNTKIYLFILLTIFLFTSPYFIIRQNKYFESTKAFRQSQSALRLSIKSIQEIEKQDLNLLYQKLHFIINKYISNKSNIFIERSSKEIIELCKQHSIPSDFIKKLSTFLQHSDAVRYSPISSLDKNNDIIIIKEILEKIDKSWV